MTTKKINNNEIDLHGVKHSEVQKIIDSFLWENMKKNKKEVRVITGLSDQMKRIVSDITKEYQMDYYEDPLNGGVLIINIR